VPQDEDGLSPVPPPPRRRLWHRRARETPPARPLGWRGWLPVIARPLRRGVLLFLVVLIIEYLVIPELTGASKDLHLLGQVNPYWLAAGLILEGLSLFCYGLLTRALLPPEGRPGLSRLFRIDLAAAAVAHVIPAGTLGSAGIGYRLFTAEGIPGVDAGVMMAAKGIGSTVVLNVLLWVSLVISIPLAGFHPIYVTVAIIGAVVMLAVGLLILGVTRGTGRAVRIMRAIGRRFPRAGDRLENVIRDATANLSALARDRRVLTESLTWASLNWILDAASLWCFVAAFGRFVNPVELFAAYGIANVAGALPVTPAGLGVVDSVTPLLLVSFGVTRNVATLGVLGWRLVNFWMPIPAGALAYATLKVPRGAGLGAMRQAVSGMMSRGDTAGERPPPRPASPRSTSVNPEGTSVNPDGTSVRSDGTAAGPDGTSVRSEDGTSVTPPGRADGSAAQAGSGHDTAGGPARGDSVFGDAP
jgi:uncharacterized protein (TIRG00374 family)